MLQAVQVVLLVCIGGRAIVLVLRCIYRSDHFLTSLLEVLDGLPRGLVLPVALPLDLVDGPPIRILAFANDLFDFVDFLFGHFPLSSFFAT